MHREILITGVSSGLGLHICQKLLEKNHKVVGLSRNKPSLEHPNFEFLACDLSKPSDIEQVLMQVKASRKIDSLINNAGIARVNHSLTISDHDILEIMQINYLAAYKLARSLSKGFIKRKHARIVNISSISATLHIAGESAYSASKAAMESMTMTLAKELADFGISVNAIAPPILDTRLSRSLSAKQKEDIRARQIYKKAVSVDDIFSTLDFILEEKNDFLTGQIFHPGGLA